MKGEYYFRTIKPVPYIVGNTFRTPHIHFAVSRHGERLFTSQMLVNGHPDNARDRLTQRIEDPVGEGDDSRRLQCPAGVDDRRADRPLRHRARQTVEELEDGSLGWGLGRV